MFTAVHGHSYDVPRPHTMRTLGPHEIGNREAVLVRARALVLPPSGAVHVQHLHGRIDGDAVDAADAQGIQPVNLRHAEHVSVELRERPGARFDGKPRREEASIDRPTRRIHGGCVQ